MKKLLIGLLALTVTALLAQTTSSPMGVGNGGGSTSYVQPSSSGGGGVAGPGVISTNIISSLDTDAGYMILYGGGVGSAFTGYATTNGQVVAETNYVSRYGFGLTAHGTTLGAFPAYVDSIEGHYHPVTTNGFTEFYKLANGVQGQVFYDYGTVDHATGGRSISITHGRGAGNQTSGIFFDNTGSNVTWWLDDLKVIDLNRTAGHALSTMRDRWYHDNTFYDTAEKNIIAFNTNSSCLYLLAVGHTSTLTGTTSLWVQGDSYLQGALSVTGQVSFAAASTFNALTTFNATNNFVGVNNYSGTNTFAGNVYLNGISNVISGPVSFNTNITFTVSQSATASGAIMTNIIDFGGAAYQMVSCTNNLFLATTNRVAGRSVTLKIISAANGNAATNALVTAGSWVPIGATLPNSIATNRQAILNVTCFGTDPTNVFSAFSAQP